MSRTRKYRRPPNPQKAARAAREYEEAQEREHARNERIKAMLARNPPPPDPQVVTAPEEVAERTKAWRAWWATLSPAELEDLRVGHLRMLHKGAVLLPVITR